MDNPSETSVSVLSVRKVRRWFATDTAARLREPFSGHRETRRLSRTLPGPEVRTVLQLQHRRYGDERHDAEQQGQQHQSLRYAVLRTRSPRVVLRAYIHTYAYDARAHTRINRIFIRWRTLVPVLATSYRCYAYVCTKQQSIRLTAINTLSPCTLFSLPSPCSAPVPPLLYHPQRCTRMVQLTHRTIMRYRNSARCPCSTRTAQDAGLPFPAAPATRTASSPRPLRVATRQKTKRYESSLLWYELQRAAVRFECSRVALNGWHLALRDVEIQFVGKCLILYPCRCPWTNHRSRSIVASTHFPAGIVHSRDDILTR